jgi:hypothetical protein
MKINNEKSIDKLKNELESLRKENNVYLVQKIVNSVSKFPSYIEKPIIYHIDMVNKNMEGLSFNIECSENDYFENVGFTYTEIENNLRMNELEINEQNIINYIEESFKDVVYYC